MSSDARELAYQQRDRRLRRRLLRILHDCRANEEQGWITGRFAKDLIDGFAPRGERADSDQHLLAMLRDLVAGGYAEERDDREHKWQSWSLDFLSFRVTAKGNALITESVDADPIIEDDRL